MQDPRLRGDDRLNILVTGAGGFVGGYLCDYLREQKHMVRAGDRAQGWAGQLQGVDVVVHLAARVHVLQGGEAADFEADNVTATRALAEQAVAAGVRRFVFISTIGAHGNACAAPLTEESPIHPAGGYAMSKWRAEQALREVDAIETVILRPPLIYGPGVKANFARLLRAVASVWPLPFGAVANARDYISVANVCHAIAFVAAHPQAADETFLLCDGEAISTRELIERLAEAMHKPAKMLAVPPAMLQFGAMLTGKTALYESVCGSRRIDDAKLRALGWRPPQDEDEALHEVGEWYVETH